MRKATTVLMTSTLILSSIFPSVVHATENTIDNGVQNTNTVSINLDAGNNISPEETSNEEVDTKSPSISEENVKQESLNNVPATSETNYASEQTPETETNAMENDDIYASGTAGTCDWYVTNEGVLHIGAGELSSTGEAFSPWYDYRAKINKIVFDSSVTANESLNYLFFYLYNVTVIEGLNLLDTSEVTRMYMMFGNMTSLRSVDVSSFDTTNVHDMFGMFYRTGLTDIDLSSFDTSKVASMSLMFYESPNLKNINLTSFDIRKVAIGDAQSMFAKCPNLENINLSSFDFLTSQAKFNLAFKDTPIKKITLSENGRLTSVMELNSPPTNETYTGKWQTVGTGTDEFPKGDWSGTTEELYERTQEGIADTYVWQPVLPPGENVTVRYVDENDQSIVDNITLSGNISEDYTTEQKNIPGYTFKEVKGNPTGEFTNQVQIVTYIYTKDEVKPIIGTVLVHYLDEDNQPIADDVVKTGSVGEDYTSEQKEIPGYTFKEVQGNPTGQFSDQAQTVTYIYTKDKVTPITGTVIVRYEDDKGNTVSDSVIKSGTVGENYTTEKKDIKGYFFKESRGKVSGAFTDETQTITYVYSKEYLEAEDKNHINNNLETEDKGKSTSGTSKSKEISVSQTDKMNSNKKNILKRNAQSLPHTGEKSSVWPLVSGGALLTLGLYTVVLRLKSRKS